MRCINLNPVILSRGSHRPDPRLVIAGIGRRFFNFLALLALCVGIAGCSLFGPNKPEQYIEYTVRKGDTVYSIAQVFGVPQSDILDSNSIEDPAQLKIGQRLRIPDYGAKSRSMARRHPDSVKTVGLSIAKNYIGALAWPVSGGRVSSGFGWRGESFHDGLDIPVKEGTPIYAAHDGVVVYAGEGFRGYGKFVALRGKGLYTIYAHASSLNVEPDKYVRQGQKIGEVGDSGNAKGTHLHFETRVTDPGGRYVTVDPFVFFPRPSGILDFRHASLNTDDAHRHEMR